MKLNLDAIKNKIAQLNGENKSFGNSNIQLWKPGVGEYIIRGMHWPTKLNLTRDGEPFVERWFYYNISNRSILAPSQFGKEDPIEELRFELFKTKNAEDKNVAKQLFPRMRCYMPLIVKEGPGADENQVLVWSFNSQIYSKLLSYFVKADIGDYLDLKEGFNIEVRITKNGKKQFLDTDVELARRPSPIAGTDEKINAIYESIPDITPLWYEMSASQIKSALDKWLTGGSQVDDNSTGTEKLSNGSDDVDSVLDEIADDISFDSVETPKEEVVEKPAAVKTAVTAAKKKPVEKHVDLDSAFKELMED